MNTAMINSAIKLFTAAAKDQPLKDTAVVTDGYWQVKITGKSKWDGTLGLIKPPSEAEQTIDGETLTVRWLSHADRIFGADGLLYQKLDNYEVRNEQLYMARVVQRSIEMGQPAIIEAGTGTGKSYAYAAVCMSMGKRVLICTSNKALQMQLWEKDIPFLQTIFPGKTVALAQGKSNYVCLENIEQHGMPSVEFREWLRETPTGSIEELPFVLENANKYTVDEECTGQRCSHFATCYYYHAKMKREAADVIICNHSLLALNHHFPNANILPDVDVVVVDEAHQFPDYCRNALGLDYNEGMVRKKINSAWSRDEIDIGEAENLLDDFQREVVKYIGRFGDRQILVPDDYIFDKGLELAKELRAIANRIFPLEADVIDAVDRKRERRATAMRSLAKKVAVITSTTRKGDVRWLDIEVPTLTSAPYDVSKFIGSMVNDEPADMDEEIAAEYEEDWEDYDDDQIEGKPTYIFTSATLATPTLQPFMKECGITTAFQMVLQSPFDFKSNAILYVPNGSTPPPTDNEKFIPYLIEEIEKLVFASRGGAFVLFTSWANMNKVLHPLRSAFDGEFNVYVQGELPKMEIIKRFKSDPKAVLFATKSFWEGVDIPGDNLRLIIIDKLPFPALSPMLKAREKTVDNPFFDLSLPAMIVDLKQGVGRLIRSHTDRGVVAILDTRLRTKQYGRTTVLDSLPFDPPVSTTGKLHDIFSSFAVKEPLPDLTKRVAFNEHDVNNFLEEIYAVDEAFEVVF